MLVVFLGAIVVIAGIAHGVGLLRRRWRANEEAAEHRAARAKEVADTLNLLIDGAVGHGIYMIDPEGRVTIWNKAAERLKGWTEQEVVGRHCAIFYPETAIAAGKPERDLARARAEGRLEEEDWRVRKNGSEFLAHVTLTALYDDQGALRGFGKVIRDVTEQRACMPAPPSSVRSSPPCPTR